MTENKRDACPIDMGKENPVKALHVFAMLGCCGEVEALLDAGVDVDAPDPSGYTPLARVAGGKDSYFMEAIESVGMFEAVVPEARLWYEDIVIPLQSRDRGDCKNRGGRLEMIRLLVARGADLEAKCREGRTPMAMAVFRHDVEIVKLLLELGASPDARGDDGMTPLLLAGVGGDSEILDMLLAAGADRTAVTTKGMGLAAVAAMQDRPDILREEIAAGRASLETRNVQGHTLLFLAAACCSVKAVRWLIEAGADVNAPDKNGITPLMTVSASGQDNVFDVVRLLLEAGADTTAMDARNHNVLYHATGYSGILLQNPLPERPIQLAALAGADLGLSPRPYKWLFPQVLVFAAIYGTEETVRTIVEKAKLRRNDKYVRMAFHGAVLWGRLDMVRLFVELFGKEIIKPRRNSIDVPAVFALLDSPHPDPEVLRYLMEQGAEVVKARRYGRSALCIAAANGHAQISRMLVAAGAYASEDSILYAVNSADRDLVSAVFGDDMDAIREHLELLYTFDENEYLLGEDDWEEDDWLADYEEEADAGHLPDDWEEVAWDSGGTELPATWRYGLIPSGKSKEGQPYVEFLRWLMSIRPPTPDERFRALCVRAERGDAESVRLLLDGADDLEGCDKSELMMWASEGGSVEIIRLFSGLGCPVDVAPQAYRGEFPLLCAVRKGHTEAVRELLALGANPKRDSFRPPLLEEALDNHGYWSKGIVTLLLEAGAPANPAKLHPYVTNIPFPKNFIDLFAAHGVNVVSRKRIKKR